MRPLSALLLSGLLLASALPAAAQQWQWRDANGRLHASDLPPPREVPDRDILKRPAAPPPRAVMPFGMVVEPPPAAAPASTAARSASAAAAASQPDAAARRKAEQAQAAARQQEQLQQQQQAVLRADNCRRAQENWRTLESGIRLSRIDERGERVPMDDAQRAQEMQRAREGMAQNCR